MQSGIHIRQVNFFWQFFDSRLPWWLRRNVTLRFTGIELMDTPMPCIECQHTFVPSSHGSKQLYCSTKCRMRAYRRRSLTRYGESNAKDQKLIAALQKEVQRLQQELRDSKNFSYLFPIHITSGHSIPIRSTSDLVPGVVLRADEQSQPRVILAKEVHSLIVQRLDTMEIGTISIFEVKAGWFRDTCVRLPGLANAWLKRNDTQ